MYLKRIKLTNFRNYKNIKVSFVKGINIIHGLNAQGKTNLLESIYVLALTNTFRNITDNELIMHDSSFFSIEGVLKKEKLDTNFSIVYSSSKKKLLIDGSEINKISNYISTMNTILFTPDNLDIIKGPPINRRRFLNTELSQLYNNYYILLNEYENVLKMRNDYIKNQKYDKNYFDIITSFLIDKNILIYKLRKKFISKINEYCEDIFYNITGIHNFNIKYKPNLDYEKYNYDKVEILKAFQEKYDSEFKFLSTFYGVHKDDFEFFLDNMNLKTFGSQGQQKISVLSLKLSEINIFKSFKNSAPILLLDDVFSEIDEIKNVNLMNYLNNDIQVIITTVSLNNCDKSILKCAKVFKIDKGKVKIQRGELNE